MINRDRQIVLEIKNVIHNMRKEGFFTDSDILDAIDKYVCDHLDKTHYNNSSWKISGNIDFERDIINIPDIRVIADKYNTTIQNIFYHKKKRGLPTRSIKKCN